MIYGVLAVFSNKEKFLAALKILDEQNLTRDCFSSFEIDELTGGKKSAYEKKNIVKKAALGGAALGLFTAFYMQWDAMAKDTPLNIAGKPLNSWPAMIPIGFVLTVLFTGISLYLALFWKLKLPQPYHPIFNAHTYDLSRGNFGILVQSNAEETKQLLTTLQADSLEEVPW